MDRILQIANAVRLEIEKWTRQKHEDYLHFDISEVNLAGACGISSWILNKILKKNKIHSELTLGWYLSDSDPIGHCWVELVKESKIVDITATQFGIKEKVFVSSPKHHRYHLCKQGKSAEFYISEYWGTQSPRTYEKELRDIYRKVIKDVN